MTSTTKAALLPVEQVKAIRQILSDHAQPAISTKALWAIVRSLNTRPSPALPDDVGAVVSDGHSDWFAGEVDADGNELVTVRKDEWDRFQALNSGPPYASDSWDVHGYASPAEEIDDMANVGRSLLDRIASIVISPGPFKGWSPMDDPAEIATDMANWIHDHSPADRDGVEDGVEAAVRKAVARCIEIARETRDGFLSEQYATDQPISSMMERFACDQVANAIENEFAIGSAEQAAIRERGGR